MFVAMHECSSVRRAVPCHAVAGGATTRWRRCVPSSRAAQTQGAMARITASGDANASALAASHTSFAAAPAARAEQGDCASPVQPGGQCGGNGMSCYGSQCQVHCQLCPGPD